MLACEAGTVKIRLRWPVKRNGRRLISSDFRLARSCRYTSGQVQFFPEVHMAALQQVVCVQCDKPEPYCTCEKYCTICKGQNNVRLCVDGLYYCPDCREACDVALASSQ